MSGMTVHGNLMGPPPTLLPDDVIAREAVTAAGSDPDALAAVAARYPAASAGWAALATDALARDRPVAAYAYARTGYHRGLDALRRSGWRGQGPVPPSHEPNLGFLRSLAALARAAELIGESDEAARCGQFLADCGAAGVTV
jgi:hypothetical protein